MSTEPIPEAFDTILVLDFGSQYVRLVVQEGKLAS